MIPSAKLRRLGHSFPRGNGYPWLYFYIWLSCPTKYNIPCVILLTDKHFTHNALLQLLSTQFVAQIYHTFPFTTCFGLMGPSSGTLGFYIRLFLFLLLSPHWPVLTHWDCVVCMGFLCPFCCVVDGNCNKALSYTQYDAEVQHF
jgi:hypothetical protein